MKIYPHYMKVYEFPNYSRRTVCVPSWNTFDDTTQFACLRVFSQRNDELTDYVRELDLYVDKHKLGRVIWPFVYIYRAKNLPDLVAELERRGLFLFDVWGHVPMVDPSIGQWGHVVPSPEVLDLFQRKLGDHFLGIDNGEQDGRYIGKYAPQMCPSPLNPELQFLNFHRHFRRMGDELGNHLTALVSLTAGHYFAKEGNTMLVGAETGQALPNSQVYYSFLRGAGKQYGVHWFGNASVWNRWGCKTYSVDKVTDYGSVVGNNRYSHVLIGPEMGTSISLLKRLMWTHIMYNSVLVGFENSWIVGDEVQARMFIGLEGPDHHLPPMDYSRSELSPIGQVQADAQSIVKERGRAGVQVTPLALMLDFYSGWAMPRHLYSEKTYQTWGNIPYGGGDFLTHHLFDLVYPGYVDSSYYRDERGYLSPTSYGDIADTLLSDAPIWVLKKYAAVVVAGELRSHVAEVADNLRRYAEEGGQVVLTGANALKLGTDLTGAGVMPESRRMEAGSIVVVGNDTCVEPHSFDLHASKPADGAEVLAQCGGMPAAIRTTLGRGEVITLLSPFGINAESLVDGHIENEVDKPLAAPFVLTKHAEKLFKDVFSKLACFDLGDGLGYVTCSRGAGRYELLVFNNALEPRPIDIQSNIGAISAKREVSLGRDVRGCRGYRPGGFEAAVLGRDTDTIIAGLSVRLFDVTVADTVLEEIPPIQPPTPPKKRGLTLSTDKSITEAVLLRPTFDQHFDALKVSWRYFEARDIKAMETEGSWLKRQAIHVIADFTDGLNFYPDLTLLENCPGQWERSRALFLHVFQKLVAIGCKNAIISLTQAREGLPFSNERRNAFAKESFARTIRELCDMAAERGIDLHLQASPRRFLETSPAALEFVAGIGAPNLFFCLDTAHSLIAGEDPVEILQEAGVRGRLVLLSAPLEDQFGQAYDVHAPVSSTNCDVRGKLRALADASRDKTLILDAVYPGTDAEYEDVRWLEACTEEGIRAPQLEPTAIC